jgi:hypothetical protein
MNDLQFVRSLLSELRLRRRIAQLQHYRQMGLLSLSQAEMYERDRQVQSSSYNHNHNNNDKIIIINDYYY